MNSRRGFTLLELIVSIAVSGIIALLVYASASAGFDTRDALARHRATNEAELRVRAMLADALRHSSDEADAGVPAFELVDATDPRGLPLDQLTFLTRGVVPPLGGSARWLMTLTPTPRGLLASAAPVEPAGAGSVSALLEQIRGLDIQVMSLADSFVERRVAIERPVARRGSTDILRCCGRTRRRAGIVRSASRAVR